MDFKGLAKQCLEAKTPSDRANALIKYRRCLIKTNSDSVEKISQSFAPLLITQLVSLAFGTNTVSLAGQLLGSILKKYPSAAAPIERKLRTLAKEFRASPQHIRQSLSLARLSKELVVYPSNESSSEISESRSSVTDVAFDAFLAAGVALEKRSAYSRRERRFKNQALLIYRNNAKLLSGSSHHKEYSLLKAIEKAASSSSPMAKIESLVAITILATIHHGNDKECEAFSLRFLQVCANLALRGGEALCEDVVRCAGGVLKAGVTTGSANDSNKNTTHREAVTTSYREAMPILMAVVEKTLLRQKETALGALPVFLGAVEPLDLSSGVEKILLPATRDALKSSKEATRQQGLMLVQLLVQKVKDSGIIVLVGTSLLESLESAKLVYQKATISEAVEALAALDTLLLDEQVTTVLLGWLSQKGETSEEARSAGTRALMVWASRSQSTTLSNNLATQILSLIKGSYNQGDCIVALRTLSIIGERDGLSSFVCLRDDIVESFTKFLCATVKSEKMKQETQIHAANLLLILRTSNIKVKSMYEEEVNSLLLSEHSPLIINTEEVREDALLGAISAVRKLYLVKKNWTILDASHKLCHMLLRCAADNRANISQKARSAVKAIRTTLNGLTDRNFLEAFWGSELLPYRSIESKSSESADGTEDSNKSERLGKALCDLMLPSPIADNVGIALLIAHHPGLSCLSRRDHRSQKAPQSRFWKIIEQNLPKLSDESFDGRSEDWLTDAVDYAVGETGLRSAYPEDAIGAVNAISDLAKIYPERVVKITIPTLKRLAHEAVGVTEEGIEIAERVLQPDRSEHLANGITEDNPHYHSNSRKTGRSKSGASARDRQQEQAEKDRARRAAAALETSKRKFAREQEIAVQVSRQLRLTKAGLLMIRALARSARKTVYSRMPALLSATIPTATIRPLKGLCISTLLALTASAPPPLTKTADDLAFALFCLESGCPNDMANASLLDCLQASIPPPLSAESFALIAPVVKAAMMSEAQVKSSDSRSEAASKRREASTLAKKASQILAEQTKPEALDSAIAAASARAGSWAIKVMEREDGAFGAASEALANLAGTALNPNSNDLSQILEGLLSSTSSVRESTLLALERIPALSIPNAKCPRDSTLGRSLALATQDPEEENAEIAKELWQCYGHELIPSEDVPILSSLLAHKADDVRTMAAKTIAKTLSGECGVVVRNKSLSQIFLLYMENRTTSKGSDTESKTPPQRRMKKGDQEVPADSGWLTREGVALTLQHMASRGILAEHVPVAFAFFIARGLGDPEEKVRSKIVAAAFSTIENASIKDKTLILSMIERQLQKPPPKTLEEIAHADRTRENLVMCLGSVVGFLDRGDPRIGSAAEQVIKTAMNTPSEAVQNAAAKCLSRLANSYVNGKAHELEVKDRLLGDVYNSKSSFGERRGAAYSLAGLVGGLGLQSVHRMKLIEELRSKGEDKSSARNRQSAMILFEAMSTLLGSFIEPFVPALLPLLLSCMSDSTQEVRKASWSAASASMNDISSHGVKLILPKLTSGLTSSQWRTKAGSADILGAMAFSAPRQMATSLPQIVPRLAATLADPHRKVTQAADDALARIAAVIRNPEVRNLSPFLMAALRNPSDRTAGAIDAMLRTSFTHAIDPASLSLLVPPLHRGLRDRTVQLRLRSAAIMGSMCDNVSSPTDVLPYLPQLLPPLKTVLLDSNPDVRKTAAKGLGSLVGALGTSQVPDILPWLRRAVVSSAGVDSISSSAERSGAAAGLAEVCSSLADSEVNEIVRDTLAAGKASIWAREGGLLLIGSLPEALGDRFESNLTDSLASILSGLADDSDNVREAALQAGKCVVRIYGISSRDRLLPELMRAMCDKVWRIRQNATRLLGDLMLVIAGATIPTEELKLDSAGNDEELPVSSDAEEGDDEQDPAADEVDEEIDSPESAAAVITTEATMKALEEELGPDSLNTILAALYMIRCDAIFRVRQSGMEVWKRIVSNTPRVLRDILPFAIKQIVGCLAEEDAERRESAAKALSDLTMKLGDRVIPEILPSLRSGMQMGKDDKTRSGSIEGLLEIVQSCGKGKILDHADDFTQATVEGLADPLPDVRARASAVLNAIMRPLGKDAVEEIISSLVNKVCDTEKVNHDECLHSIRQIVETCGTGLLASLIPLLLRERPLKLGPAMGLQAAIEESGVAFEPYVGDVLDVLLGTAEEHMDDDVLETAEHILAALNATGGSVADLTISTLAERINDSLSEKRAASSVLLGALCRGSEAKDMTPRTNDLTRILVRQMAETNSDALRAAWKTFGDLVVKVSPRVLAQDIPVIRQGLRSALADLRVHEPDALLPGLQVPKAPEPFVSVLVEGLLHGSPELREQAALGMSELVELTDPKVLRPYVIKLTGPLIRVMSDRFPWQVKAAILRTCLKLLEKASTILRTFGPQLQNTFVKNLSDGSRLVRTRASACLGALAPVLTRVEQLLRELVTIGKTGATSEAQAAAFQSFSRVVRKAKKIPDGVFQASPESIIAVFKDDDDIVGEAAGRALGTLASVAPSSVEYTAVVDTLLKTIDEPHIDYTVRNSILLAIGRVLIGGLDVPGVSTSHIDAAKDKIFASLKSENYLTRCVSCTAAVSLYTLQVRNSIGEKETAKTLLALAELTSDAEVCIYALSSMKKMNRNSEMAEILTPSLVVCSANSNAAVKSAADRILCMILLKPGGTDIDADMIQAAKKNLGAEDAAFIDRLIPKLQVLPTLDVGGE